MLNPCSTWIFPEPAPGPHDLLVEIRAVANPLDTKMRARAQPAPGHWKVLGWDASGMVRAVGADVTLFKQAIVFGMRDHYSVRQQQ